MIYGSNNSKIDGKKLLWHAMSGPWRKKGVLTGMIFRGYFVERYLYILLNLNKIQSLTQLKYFGDILWKGIHMFNFFFFFY
jgi:hypothetical protein